MVRASGLLGHPSRQHVTLELFVTRFKPLGEFAIVLLPVNFLYSFEDFRYICCPFLGPFRQTLDDKCQDIV